MTLERHQILAISKQNLDAPTPELLGNTPLLPQALLSLAVLTDCQQSSAEQVPALQPHPRPLPACHPCFSWGDQIKLQAPSETLASAQALIYAA